MSAPERFRKHYFTTITNHTIPADTTFHYRIVAVPSAARGAHWQAEAAGIAAT